jgi:hypothetical protein
MSTEHKTMATPLILLITLDGFTFNCIQAHESL